MSLPSGLVLASPPSFLILLPGSQEPDVPGYISVRSSTHTVFLVTRSLDADRTKGAAFYQGVKAYAYADKDEPKAAAPHALVNAGDTRWGCPVRGMDYWQLLVDRVQHEVVQERDRQFMAMMKALGIEKGKPFAPDARQKKLLAEAAVVGEAMAKVFSRRDPTMRRCLDEARMVRRRRRAACESQSITTLPGSASTCPHR